MNDLLGIMDLSPAIPDYIYSAGRDLAAKLVKVYPCPPGTVDREYLHWAVAPHGRVFTDYNIMIVLLNGTYHMVVANNPQNNAEGVNNNSPASHTEHRNTGAIGISVDGFDGATIHDFGPDGDSLNLIWYMCAAAAAAAKAYGIDTLANVTHDRPHLDDTNSYTVHTIGEPIIATHAECAVWDNYPADRWDWGITRPLPVGAALTPAMRTATANSLRQLIHNIKLKL